MTTAKSASCLSSFSALTYMLAAKAVEISLLSSKNKHHISDWCEQKQICRQMIGTFFLFSH